MDLRALADLLERVDRALAVQCGLPFLDPLRHDVAEARTQLHTLAEQIETAWTGRERRRSRTKMNP